MKSMVEKKIEEMLENVSGGCNPQRLRKALEAYGNLSEDERKRFRFEECSDESTGHRYGNAKCRVGKCTKIGSCTYRYQIWAVWN